mmetsp:Transcript_45031/g.114008  ORF Transcript_45031/g.114008 Transcript_45031/m.114008 type:complete len:221 (+) Transcript_45031:288-950(+)
MGAATQIPAFASKTASSQCPPAVGPARTLVVDLRCEYVPLKPVATLEFPARGVSSTRLGSDRIASVFSASKDSSSAGIAAGGVRGGDGCGGSASEGVVSAPLLDACRSSASCGVPFAGATVIRRPCLKPAGGAQRYCSEAVSEGSTISNSPAYLLLRALPPLLLRILCDLAKTSRFACGAAAGLPVGLKAGAPALLPRRWGLSPRMAGRWGALPCGSVVG